MCRASAEDKYYAIRLTKHPFKKRKKKLKTHVGSTCKTRGVLVGPHVFYMFYMNILYVIGFKNIRTVLLKLYNQFYMNILYEIICKNAHTFVKKNIWTPRVFLIFLRFLKECFISLIA